MLIVYTGRGKGKTSAAIGTVFRAIGAEKKVGYIQFMKEERNDASKLSSYFSGLEFYSFGTKAFVDPKALTKESIQEAEKGWKKALELFDRNDLIILDELNVCLSFGLLDKTKIIDKLKLFTMQKTNKPSSYKWPIVVCTGIDCPQELIEISDLATEMKEIKHPYGEGYLATKGIDF